MQHPLEGGCIKADVTYVEVEMSDQLQDICMSQGLPIYRPASGDAIEVIATGDYPTASHWFRIFERPNGQVGILLDFPAYETKGIEHVDRFCELVTENFFGSCGRLYFNQAEKRFFLGGIAEKKTLASHLTSLAYGCDDALPLCESVGREGWWSDAAINMALADPVELCSA